MAEPQRDMRYQATHDRLKALYPDAFCQAHDFIAAATLAKAGFGITLVDSSQVLVGEGLAFVPYLPNRFFEYAAFYRKDNYNPAIARFCEAADELYGRPTVFCPMGKIRPLDEFMGEHPELAEAGVGEAGEAGGLGEVGEIGKPGEFGGRSRMEVNGMGMRFTDLDEMGTRMGTGVFAEAALPAAVERGRADFEAGRVFEGTDDAFAEVERRVRIGGQGEVRADALPRCDGDS